MSVRTPARRSSKTTSARCRSGSTGRSAASRSRWGRAGQRLAELGAGLRTELRTDIAALRAELIKWSFVFFATAALAVIGLR